MWYEGVLRAASLTAIVMIVSRGPTSTHPLVFVGVTDTSSAIVAAPAGCVDGFAFIAPQPMIILRICHPATAIVSAMPRLVEPVGLLAT